ncbi:hypothetical protein BAY61_06580 [Prauserella marina]|uniref:Uncharacterized protein n=1 Tax=Prauserella marina TaxID=530584 RepID=A0A222VL99_9PSEU|nr:hypothetical protein [Prauserella marina]ASR34700.1 hypothetical protein BAY61_06580 [Prauserella marina]PWV85641.1 hypothetical protein DES30_1011669 [Prauserella marina]SDC49637.1 hypothetical protein SAMN05421630_102322 [Prauserella marina]
MFGLRVRRRAGRSRLRRSLVATGVAAAAGAAVIAGAVPASAAEPPTLAGAWAPLNRCPVDAPAMLAADGAQTAALCLAASGDSGTMQIGGKTVPVGKTDLQFGVTRAGSTFTVVSPSGGALSSAPVKVPGGLLNLMCPSDIPVISGICDRLADAKLNAITAYVEPAGAPSQFNFVAGIGVDQPIVNLPIKIRLDNPILGSNCYLGSNSNPIVLRPANTTRPAVAPVRFDEDGTLDPAGQMGYVGASGADQADNTFSVPGANGCGLFGALDWAVNLQLGLPSPAGENSFVLNSTQTAFGGHFTPLTFAPDQGQRLSEHWHAAVR